MINRRYDPVSHEQNVKTNVHTENKMPLNVLCRLHEQIGSNRKQKLKSKGMRLAVLVGLLCCLPSAHK